MEKEETKFEHKKSLGQHFLNNERIPRKMAEAGDVGKGDIVLEIGPGIGILTRELLSRGAYVTALEADIRAIERLQTTFHDEIEAGRLTLIHGDAREINLEKLGFKPYKYKVVANIPYYISGLLFRTFLESDFQPSLLVFLVQREVAERIVRDPKESILSLSVKIFGFPEYVETVKPGNFTPPPKVDSAIIVIRDISKKSLGTIPAEFFFSIVHEGFKSRRKQLIGNLSTILGREELTHIFSTLTIPLNVRGEDLSPEVWLKLVHKIFVHK